MTDVYEKLRQRLDDMATGYPPSADGVEIKILKRLFSEADAEMFLLMTPMLETPEAVAGRLNLDPVQTAAHLEDMAYRGLLFRQRKPDMVRYATIPFVVGVFEFQLKKVDKELAHDLQTYYQEALGKTFAAHNTAIMRTIPIHRRLVEEWPVAPYEDVLGIFDQQKTIAVAPCICRTTQKKLGQGCDKPLEACFLFGSHAQYYVDNHMGRFIDKEEAKELVKKNEAAGLVMQPFNSQHVGGMCSCCGDCCGILRSLKKQPVPAAAVKSNYYAAVEEANCIGCEDCIDRCQMDAVSMRDDLAHIDLDRCIGCGLCVTTCPSEALRLVKKADDQLYEPPASGMETYIRIAQERGKI